MTNYYYSDPDFLIRAERQANALRAQVLANGLRAAFRGLAAVPGRLALMLRRTAHI
ncbi:RSP_7527 family protein [Halovulum sp. GXIMD14794]